MSNENPSKTPLPAHLKPKRKKGSEEAASKGVESPDVETVEDDSSQMEKLGKAGLRGLPPALISFIFHVLVIIVFALIYIPGDGTGGFGFFLETESADDEFDQFFELSSDEDFVPEVNATDMEFSSAESMESFEPDLVKIESAAPTPINPSNDPGFALSGRGEQNRKGLMRIYGGTPETENAVELGLQWLARNQLKDGSWSLKGPYRSLVAEENSMAATGLALLAFLGHGETHQKGKYKTVVDKGLKYLIRNQSGNGHFLERRASLSHSLYTHAICSICICELIALTQDESLIGPARKAVEFAENAQGEQGGWKYEVGSSRSDLSVTGWFVMLFQSAKYAGIEFDPNVMKRAELFVESVMLPDGSRYRYESDHEPSLAMTAEGLLCRQYLGWKQTDPRLEAGAKYMLANPIRWSQKNVYYWYYATQVLRNLDEKTWKQWNEQLTTILPGKQRKTGVEKGSWDHEGDPYGGPGGRLYVTCLCIYSLEVYYRHLPIYQMRK